MKKEVLLLSMVFIFNIVVFSQEKRKEIKDDPINRVIYEYNRLIDPFTGQIPDKIREKELEFINSQKLNGKLKGAKATSWVHRGPFNVGGRTRALAIDVNNENIILAGGVSGGMWRSTDGGNSWTKTTGSSDLHSVTAIAQDTRSGQGNTWYYATGELSGNSAGEVGALYRGNGLFKSVDNGISWSEIISSTSNNPQGYADPFQYCWNVKVNPVNGYVFVATYKMIFYSTDGGDSWSESLSGGSFDNATYTDIVITSTGIIYATLSNNDDHEGVWRSTDGLFWTNITPIDFPTSLKRIVLDIAPSNENIVYFLANTPGEGINDHSLWKYEYITGDGSGANGNWTNLSNQLPAEGGSTGDFDSQGSYDLLIKVKPDNSNFVIIGGINLYRSTDGYATANNTTWIGGYTPTNDSYGSYTNQHADQHSLVFYKSDPNKVISGHDGGLSRTNDISSNNAGEEKVAWTFLNTGYLTTQAYTVAIPSVETIALSKSISGVDAILSGFQDNGTWLTESSSGTVNWEMQLSGDGSFCAFGINSRYTSSQNGSVYGDFYDNQGNFDYWTRVDPDGATDQLFINPFILDPNNTDIMYYPGGDMVWRNSNLTEIPQGSNDPATTNWFSMSKSIVSGSTITAMDVSKSPANILYYGAANSKLFKLIDANTGDPNPVEITGTNFPSANIGCVLVNPTDTSEIFTTFTNYSIVSIWHSINGGQSWESISGNLEENVDGSGNGPSVRWISTMELATDSSIYFLGTSTGLFSTTKLDGDNTIWLQEDESGIGNVVVTMVKTRKNGTVVIGTHANGIYSAQYDIDTYTPKDPLYQLLNAVVYPNPSNGIFNLEIEGEHPGDYLIAIYDMQGKPVYFSEQKNKIVINQQIDLQKHAKGIYNIEIVKGGRASSYKIIIK